MGTITKFSGKDDDEIIAYLSYALKDVRKISPLGAHLLEMSIAVLNEDIRTTDDGSGNGKAAKYG
jgi:hypothetical protein